jgi:hypothetical protein
MYSSGDDNAVIDVLISRLSEWAAFTSAVFASIAGLY